MSSCNLLQGCGFFACERRQFGRLESSKGRALLNLASVFKYLVAWCEDVGAPNYCYELVQLRVAAMSWHCQELRYCGLRAAKRCRCRDLRAAKG